MINSKILVVSLAIFSVVSFLAEDLCLGGIDNDGWKASPELVAKLTLRRSEANYDERKVPEYTLPDSLLMSDGTKVTSAQAWKTGRRPEVLELFRTHVYGRSPIERPPSRFSTLRSGLLAIWPPVSKWQSALPASRMGRGWIS